MSNVIKIVAFGDIIGRPGRRALEIIVPDIRKEYSPDLIIGNGENLAHNEGTTEKTLNEILKNGIDFVTLGDHAFDRDPEMKRIFRLENYKSQKKQDCDLKFAGKGIFPANCRLSF